ncbi:hypothetical protein FHW17_002037 [Phyllobacterium sp. P30BS-XVII]|nr:hypothetical protein [Phyllobacterium sp. P30BS-XVII]
MEGKEPWLFWMVRGSWFDKLTMRESVDERVLNSATFVICNVDDYRCIHTLPHGELVEPRTTNHEPRTTITNPTQTAPAGAILPQDP